MPRPLSSPPPYALLACDVFSEEITLLGQQIRTETGKGPWPWSQLAYLPMGLHDQPEALRAEVQSCLDRWDDEPGFSTIVLAYGLCGQGLLGVCARHKTLILPRAHDCISLLLGSTAAQQAVLHENPGTYFYSPGWIRGHRVPGPDRAPYLRQLYAARYPDDPELVEELIEADTLAFAHHHCAAYVDLTENHAAENYCRHCAEYLGWSFRKLHGQATWLRRLLVGDWASGDFVSVPPGHTLAAAHDGTLVQARPIENAT